MKKNIFKTIPEEKLNQFVSELIDLVEEHCPYYLGYNRKGLYNKIKVELLEDFDNDAEGLICPIYQ